MLRQAQRAECPAPQKPPPPPPPSPRAFDWRQSFLLELLDLAVQAAGPSGIDELVRTATGGSGALEVPDWLLPHALSNTIPGFAELTVDVARANVSGLDSFSKFELLEAVSADAAGLYSAIDLDRLQVCLELRLSIVGGGGPRQLPPLSVCFGLADVSVEATGRFALDADGIAAMQLRQLANCTFRQVLEGSLVSAGAHASLRRLTIDGGPGGHAALARPVLLKLPAVAEQLVSGAVNEWARGLLRTLRQRATCPAPADHPPSIVDLAASPAVREMAEIIDDLLGAKGNHSVSPLETFVQSLAADLKRLVGLRAGALRLPARFLDLWVTDPKVGQIGVQLSNLSLSGLDADFAVRLLEPAAPHLLTHTLGAGGAAPLRAAVHLQTYLGGRWHGFDVALELRNISLELATPLRFDRNALGSLSLGQARETPG